MSADEGSISIGPVDVDGPGPIEPVTLTVKLRGKLAALTLPLAFMFGILAHALNPAEVPEDLARHPGFTAFSVAGLALLIYIAEVVSRERPAPPA